jgi:hypothetical protein
MTERERQLTAALRRLADAVVHHGVADDPEDWTSFDEVMAALKQARLELKDEA